MAGAALTPELFAHSRHVIASRRGVLGGPVDEALASIGLERKAAAIAGGFVAALALARGTDVVACVPERHTEHLRDGLHTFALTFATPELSIAMFWHPRCQGDGGMGGLGGWWGRFVVGCGDDWRRPIAIFGQSVKQSLNALFRSLGE